MAKSNIVFVSICGPVATYTFKGKVEQRHVSNIPDFHYAAMSTSSAGAVNDAIEAENRKNNEDPIMYADEFDDGEPG